MFGLARQVINIKSDPRTFPSVAGRGFVWLEMAGGGSGGSYNNTTGCGGGAGGTGSNNRYVGPITAGQIFSVAVGAGGAGKSNAGYGGGAAGSDSSFYYGSLADAYKVVAPGAPAGTLNGANSGNNTAPTGATGYANTTGYTTPATNPGYPANGYGGWGGAGSQGPPNGGLGGNGYWLLNGLISSIIGNKYVAHGGGAGTGSTSSPAATPTHANNANGPLSIGNSGFGCYPAVGTVDSVIRATAGDPNTGIGGGGGADKAQNSPGANAGSGYVAVYYSSAYRPAVVTGSPTLYVTGGYRIYFFTGSGSISF